MHKVEWYSVVRLPLEQNLLPFIKYVQEQGILVHVTEKAGQQQLWISDQSRVIDVAEWAAQFLSGNLERDFNEQSPNETEIDLGLKDSETSGNYDIKSKDAHGFSLPKIVLLLKLLPVTLCSLLFCLVGTLLVAADKSYLSLAEPFLYQGLEQGYFIPFNETIAAGQYWRLLTPIFLHFTWLHLVFNGIIFWDIGRRIELVKKPLHLLSLVIIVGLISNAAQYLVQANTVFGGLSGVVYGVIGYIAVYQRLNYHPVLQFNTAAIIFFIAWLLLGVFGIIDVFISGSIANAAHVAGLLSGAFFGLLVGLSDRTKNVKSS